MAPTAALSLLAPVDWHFTFRNQSTMIILTYIFTMRFSPLLRNLDRRTFSVLRVGGQLLVL
jgi:hypothetical protein